jgi:hypothetical protein
MSLQADAQRLRDIAAVALEQAKSLEVVTSPPPARSSQPSVAQQQQQPPKRDDDHD